MLHLERDVSAFIAPSEFMRETLISWGISADRTELIRNFTDAAREHTARPRTYGLYLGRLTAEKGLDVMVRALVAAGDPEFKIAGDGPYEGELKQMVAGAGLSNTHFLGRVERGDIPGLFAGARFMALPSIWDENAPLAAMEAMAHGLPLLVSDKGGLPELAQGRGVVCPAGDVRAFAGGIDRLTAEESERLGREARLFAAEHLTAAKHRGELERAYRRAIEKQGAVGI
jgi:glycosyltransferase involved in cell wall biosynthesis